MFAVSLDNLLFLLLIAVAALFQLLSKAVSKAGKSDSSETSNSPKPQTRRPIERAPRESDADRIRKFLEALGQPPSSTPPPPVLPRSNIPPRRLAPVHPPPVIIPGAFQLPQTPRQKPDITRRETALPEQPTRLQEIVSPTVPPPATPAVEGHEALAVEPQQSPIIEIPVETYAAPKVFRVTKGADFSTDISALLASKSSLRKAVLLREILGTPRALQSPDLTL